MAPRQKPKEEPEKAIETPEPEPIETPEDGQPTDADAQDGPKNDENADLTGADDTGDQNATEGENTPQNAPDGFAGPTPATVHEDNGTDYEAKVKAPEGRILEPDEEFVFEGEVVGAYVVPSEDVYRKIYPGRSRRPSFVQLAVKGAALSMSNLQSVGGITAEQKAKRDEAAKKDEE